MSQPSPSPSRGREPLPNDAFEALDRLVAAYGPGALIGRRVHPAAAADLRRVAVMLCADARRQDPRRAERLVKTLHNVWRALPAVQQLSPDDGRSALLDRVVSACIKTFYEPSLVVDDVAPQAARRRMMAE